MKPCVSGLPPSIVRLVSVPAAPLYNSVSFSSVPARSVSSFVPFNTILADWARLTHQHRGGRLSRVCPELKVYHHRQPNSIWHCWDHLPHCHLPDQCLLSIRRPKSSYFRCGGSTECLCLADRGRDIRQDCLDRCVRGCLDPHYRWVSP